MVTGSDRSDWALSPATIDTHTHPLFIEIEREGPKIFIRYAYAGGGVSVEDITEGRIGLTMLRKCTTFANDLKAMDIGIMAACPKNTEGFVAVFEKLTIRERS